jgi:hypothetical protein
MEAAFDQVEMAVCNGIERPGINDFAGVLAHGIYVFL